MIHPELLSALSLPSYLVHSLGRGFETFEEIGNMCEGDVQEDFAD
jgi:hypothetical protein